MYPKNAASPEKIPIGPVVQISDGAVQTSGVTVRIIPTGVAEGDGAGTTAYSTDGVVLYTPTQAETNYASFILIAKKTGCIPASQMIVPTESAVAGRVSLGAILGSALTGTAAQIAAAFTKFFNVATPTGTVNSLPDAVAGAANGVAIVGSDMGSVTSVSGAVASVTGNVGGNVTGSVGSVVGAVGSVTGNLGGNVNGNVAGSVASVAGAVGSVSGPVGSVTGDVGGKVIGGGAGTITGDGVQAASVTGSVGSVAGAVGSVSGAVGSVTGNVGGNVAGDVQGKIIGGGAGSITGDGVRASAVTGAVGSVTGSVGSVVGAVGSVTAGVTISGTLATLDAIWTKIKAWLRLALRSDAAIATDHATELAEINQDMGTGAGDYGPVTDSLESIRDNASAPTAAAVADAIWDEALSGHAVAGSAGAALSAAGNAGDPWQTPLPGAYSAGQAGYIIGNQPSAADIAAELGGNNVVATFPLLIEGEETIIIQGEDYFDADGNAATVTITATGIETAVADDWDFVFWGQGDPSGQVVTGSPSSGGANTITVKFDLPAAKTSLVTAGLGGWRVVHKPDATTRRFSEVEGLLRVKPTK